MSSLHISEIRKRDGSITLFDESRITNAIFKAGQATREIQKKEIAEKLTKKVISLLKRIYAEKDSIITVEEVQDIVEITLMREGYEKSAKSYILYRNEHARLRASKREVPAKVRQLVSQSKKYFRNNLGEFIYYRTYSRWIESEGRRETWIETVDRYLDFMKENLGNKLKNSEYDELREAILKQEVMPSMRLMWGAGKAARKTNVTGYNCSYIAPSHIKDFAEIMYLLMCGAGVGFSAESSNVQELPIIKIQTGKKLKTHVVADSKEGWGDALTIGLTAWYNGHDIDFDFSQLRPAGARLYTMGGKSSGPEPLRSLLSFARDIILKRQGKRLRNIDVHDLICKIGEIVVAGGVRRSALISLSDLDDEEIRDAKKGQFYISHPHRSLANNSAAYNEKPSNVEFMEEWLALAKSGSGERGIFNRAGLKTQMPKRRLDHTSSKDFQHMGSNPCGEINLRSKQFCNLTEIVARVEDTKETLLRKARLASILGTYQSTLTNFPYLSKEWQENCEAERLLGVSITGQWDSKTVRDPEIMSALKEETIATNKKYAKRFNINPSASVTCVKPSGTVSQLVDASSGMHPRHAEYYIRRVRIAATDSLFKMLKDQGYPYFPEVGQTEPDAITFVLEFPIKSPAKSIYKDDMNAIEQLNYWKMVKEHFTEHNPSVTVSVGDDEWIKVSNWVYNNWDMIGGLSFLPRSNHVYKLAPYEEITKEQYEAMVARLPKIDFSEIVIYEQEDNTQGAKELACVSGVCEVDLVVAPPVTETKKNNSSKIEEVSSTNSKISEA